MFPIRRNRNENPGAELGVDVGIGPYGGEILFLNPLTAMDYSASSFSLRFLYSFMLSDRAIKHSTKVNPPLMPATST